MHKIGVVSDSHGHERYLRLAAETLAGCDYVIHCGDYSRDTDILRETLTCPVVAVAGNCDGFCAAPRLMEMEWAGMRLLLTHGDRYQVKSGLMQLSLLAQEHTAKLVLYGHTHRSDVTYDNGILFVNPGALMMGRCAVIEYRAGGPTPLMIDLDDLR